MAYWVASYPIQGISGTDPIDLRLGKYYWTMAVPAKNPSTQSSLPEIGDVPRDLVREKAAELYGQGYKRSQIARILEKHLCPKASGPTVLRQCRNKLAKWEKEQSFRDLIYQKAVVDVDMSTPDILKGITARAKDGRVDAARLLLEVTGRHNPKGDDHPTQVIVAFGNVPRPSLPQTLEADEYIDAEED